MNWNHRVVRMDDEDGTLLLAEVFYDDTGKNPVGYTEPFMCSESMEGLRQLLTDLTDALEKPVLEAKDLQWSDKDEGAI